MTTINVSQDDILHNCSAIIKKIEEKRAEMDEADAHSVFRSNRNRLFRDPMDIEQCRRFAKNSNTHYASFQYELCKTLVHAIENGRAIVSLSSKDYRMIFE